MPKAILSVYDKSGLVEFASGLAALGWTLIASGGTARLLQENNLAVTEVAEYTGSPEILNGRVKTLHPAIHGGLLARDTPSDLAELTDLGWDYIDLVATNLYPFEATVAKSGVTLEDAIENIDIGGVTLIRAAAKNFERVTLVCDPADYPQVLAEIKNGGTSVDTRRKLALERVPAHGTLRQRHLSLFRPARRPAGSGIPDQHTALWGKPASERRLVFLRTRAKGPLGVTYYRAKNYPTTI